jgi:hypothetical protein
LLSLRDALADISQQPLASLQAYSSRWLGIHLIAQQHDDEFDLSFARFNVEQLPGLAKRLYPNWRAEPLNDALADQR